MRHLKAGRRLGVTTAHRRAMMRNIVTSLLEHQEIECTLARAKELRKPLDKMITLGKRGDLHSRRQALSFVKTKEAMSALFGELAERYQDRQGGYSRIVRLGKRRLGDGAEMVLVQLIDSTNDVLSGLKKERSGKSLGKVERTSEDALKKVSEEVELESAPIESIKSSTKADDAGSKKEELVEDSVATEAVEEEVEVSSVDATEEHSIEEDALPTDASIASKTLDPSSEDKG